MIVRRGDAAVADDTLKRQYRLIFGTTFDELAVAPDWMSLSKPEKVQRLSSAYWEKWQKPQQSVVLPGTAVFEDAIEVLENPD